MRDVNALVRQFSASYTKESFSGYSVYDAFNSPFLKVISKFNIHLLNVAITQTFKRCPINIRPLFCVKKSINPKALGLALKGAVISGDITLINKSFNSILETITNFNGNDCWGYNWDYYTLRGGTFPKNYPNAITTYFIADALFDYAKSVYCKEPERVQKLLLSIRSFFY
jgi:hypothetical protein